MYLKTTVTIPLEFCVALVTLVNGLVILMLMLMLIAVISVVTAYPMLATNEKLIIYLHMLFNVLLLIH